MGVTGKVVLVGGGAAVGAGLLAWYLYKKGSGKDGKGWGFGIFGGGGSGGVFGGGEEDGTKPGGVEESGPLEDKRGDGGSSAEDTGGTDNGGTGSSGSSGSGSSGSGSSGSSDSGKGSGGTGGGHGGGSGGGIGSGEGQGTGGDFNAGGNEGDDNGGGADEGLYDPWEGLLIQQDLQPPDLSEKKLSDLHATISDLVVYSVLDPGTFHPHLPQPLHAFDPELGGLLKFWADVALHLEYPELPPGRLDNEIKSHVPWINLWLDTYAVAATIEAEINGSLGEA